MTNTQVSSARKFATAAFAGVVALSLMLPTQLAFADFNVGDAEYTGTEDANGNGAEGGTWAYTAEGEEMTLVDYVGEAIYASEQNLNVQLEGDSSIKDGGIQVYDGDLTINGDSSVYGKDKPSLALEGETAYIEAYGKNSDVTITDANIYANAQNVGIYAQDDLTIKDSGIYRGAENESLSYNAGDEMLLQGSELEATNIWAGELTVDNTNLTVLPTKSIQEQIDAGTWDNSQTPWLAQAIHATKSITLKGEANGEVKKYTDPDTKRSWFYISTGDDYKVLLKASSTPAYYGPQGMPATGDTTLPLTAGLGLTALFAGLLGAYALRQNKAGNVA